MEKRISGGRCSRQLSWGGNNSEKRTKAARHTQTNVGFRKKYMIRVSLSLCLARSSLSQMIVASSLKYGIDHKGLYVNTGRKERSRQYEVKKNGTTHNKKKRVAGVRGKDTALLRKTGRQPEASWLLLAGTYLVPPSRHNN